jgi:S1-C subfamily serine protease
MAEIEECFDPGMDTANNPPHAGELLAMLNTLQAGVLTERQHEIVRALRAGILALDVTLNAEERPGNSLESERARVYQDGSDHVK